MKGYRHRIDKYIHNGQYYRVLIDDLPDGHYIMSVLIDDGVIPVMTKIKVMM